ncbi:hypothetical protein RM844_10560 [Streptomyces sp. DSM 44915]|uniref:ABC transporter permease n=1 Tax=Streptomyces chisholmiae TaxID=3075540 RepID=A0ABU2JP26_9ACTN|nr:hypothetical protein [Streptomyces sp. DSM 44915]MDT0266735.1 hypothetical protein [Streptomyces sp. DSM 44915]
MWWWVRARRTFSVLLLALGVFTGAVLLLGDATVELPSILSGSANPVLFVLMAPVPVCAALELSLGSRLVEAEDTAVRRVRAWDAGLVLGVCAAALAAGGAVHLLTGNAYAVAAGRNVVFLTGLLLCVRVFVGQPAVAAPVLWVFAVIFAGFSRGGHSGFWTVLPRPSGDAPAALAAVLALALGLLLHVTVRRSVTPSTT